ncbi:hypothetical protein B0T18DRAFT_256390 [Schizothecium vesticola]|uniref:Uncharacterized protein n=1 Tax=Schizothecium vesticola TaxID=314040 RepID=A0AA40EEX7_9PEZI|nr:hypothetical protein B0T18DRAFT_256390 [Schizothecium vesticola]
MRPVPVTPVKRSRGPLLSPLTLAPAPNPHHPRQTEPWTVRASTSPLSPLTLARLAPRTPSNGYSQPDLRRRTPRAARPHLDRRVPAAPPGSSSLSWPKHLTDFLQSRTSSRRILISAAGKMARPRHAFVAKLSREHMAAFIATHRSELAAHLRLMPPSFPSTIAPVSATWVLHL